MKFNFQKILLLLFFVINFSNTHSQTQFPFYDEIQAFKKMDSINFPPSNAILFVGSSSFRKWTDVNKYFPGLKIINRGFGGSSIPDVTRFAPDIIYPYNPKQIVIYCGDNDLASSPNVTADEVVKRFKELYRAIRVNFPIVEILFVSIKPSPSRRNLMPRIVASNKLIKAYLLKKKHTAFADVYNPMLNISHQPIPNIFLSDSLHMNSKGYDIWKKVIVKYLKK